MYAQLLEKGGLLLIFVLLYLALLLKVSVFIGSKLLVFDLLEDIALFKGSLSLSDGWNGAIAQNVDNVRYILHPLPADFGLESVRDL